MSVVDRRLKRTFVSMTFWRTVRSGVMRHTPVKTRWLRPESRCSALEASSIISVFGRMRRPTETTVSAARI